MRKYILPILLIYLTIAIIIVCVTYRWTKGSGGTWDDFNKLAVIWVTLLTSLTGAIVSLIVIYKQTSAASKLETQKFQLTTQIEQARSDLSATVSERIERLRSDLAVDAAERTERLKNTLAEDLANKTEVLRNNLAKDLEFLKKRFDAESEAYGILYEAAFFFHRTLSQLEEGRFEAALIKESESMMIKASRHTIRLGKDDVNLWYEIWQEAQYIMETAKEQKSDREALKKLWKERGPDFGKMVNNFEEIAASRYRSLPKSE